jgi:hypothetical protein
MLYNRCEEIALEKEEGEEMGGAETESIIKYKEEKVIT